jgi:hypothetical protein
MHYFLPECQPTGRDKNIISKISEKAFAAEGTASGSIQTKKKKKSLWECNREITQTFKEVFQINGQKPTKQIKVYGDIT